MAVNCCHLASITSRFHDPVDINESSSVITSLIVSPSQPMRATTEFLSNPATPLTNTLLMALVNSEFSGRSMEHNLIVFLISRGISIPTCPIPSASLFLPPPSSRQCRHFHFTQHGPCHPSSEFAQPQNVKSTSQRKYSQIDKVLLLQ